MLRSRLILVLVVVAFLFSACDSIPGVSQNAIGGSSSSSSSKLSPAKGVSLEFANGNPPENMFKGERYAFSFIFENNLKQDIVNMRIRAKGYDKGFVSGIPSETSVKKISPGTTQGGPGIYNGLVLSGVVVDGFTGDYSFNPVFDYCFSAKSSFREQICVPSRRNECNIKVDKTSELDGILDVDVGGIQIVGDEVVVPLTIQDKGDGEVVNSCFKTDDFLRSYKFLGAKLGSDVGDCKVTSSEDFTLIDKKSNVLCRFDRSQDEEYASQIVVDLEYLYQQSGSLEIGVKDLDKVFD